MLCSYSSCLVLLLWQHSIVQKSFFKFLRQENGFHLKILVIWQIYCNEILKKSAFNMFDAVTKCLDLTYFKISSVAHMFTFVFYCSIIFWYSYSNLSLYVEELGKFVWNKWKLKMWQHVREYFYFEDITERKITQVHPVWYCTYIGGL